MSRLTDTQLIILSAASQRADCGVELPANLTSLLSVAATCRHPALFRNRACGLLDAKNFQIEY
jgi:hypothetical protein